VFEIGNSLREARARQGLDLTALEAETKIRAKYLRALEEERFDLLPGETYVRGFLRVYAERLDLDSQLYVDEYNSRFASGEEAVVARSSALRRRRSLPRQLESHAVLVALAGIGTVAVLVIAAWQLGGSSGTGDEPTVPAPTPAALPPAEITPPPPEPAQAAPSAPAGAPAPAPATPTPEDQAPTPAPPAAPKQARLVLEAVRGRSTVVVRRNGPDGPIVFEGTLARGQKQPFAAQRLVVDLGAPENLRIVANKAAVRNLEGPTRLVVTLGGARAEPLE
jgi:cytoskeletal protein RodZ